MDNDNQLRFTNVYHDDVIKWKHSPRYWPFVRGIHRSPVNSPHKGHWRGALMFSSICARTNNRVENQDAGDLRRHRANYDVTVMYFFSTVLRGDRDSHFLHAKPWKPGGEMSIFTAVRRFGNDFHSWLRHSWKSLPNRLTRDKKIVIHGNSCIILYIPHPITKWVNNCLFIMFPKKNNNFVTRAFVLAHFSWWREINRR